MVGDTKLNMQIWDTVPSVFFLSNLHFQAGQDRFRSMTALYDFVYHQVWLLMQYIDFIVAPMLLFFAMKLLLLKHLSA